MISNDRYKKIVQKIALVIFYHGIKNLQIPDQAKKIKGLRLPYSSGSSHLPSFNCKKGASKIKTSQSILANQLFEKTQYTPLFKAAFIAHRFCMGQDIHLLKFQQLFLEHGFLIKGAMSWKLPKSFLAMPSSNRKSGKISEHRKIDRFSNEEQRSNYDQGESKALFYHINR